MWFSHDALLRAKDIISHLYQIYNIDLSRGGNALAKDCIDDQPRDDEANEIPVLDPNKILCKIQISE